MNAIPLTKLEAYWTSKFDKDDLYVKNLIYRYLQHTKNLRKLQTVINKNGVENNVQNGQQSYAKPHAALKEMRDLEKEIQKIENQLIKLSDRQETSKPKERKPMI